VWGSPSYPAAFYERELEELTDAGDELGLHPHNWRWHDPARGQNGTGADPGPDALAAAQRLSLPWARGT